MRTDQREFTFVVRIRQQVESSGSHWRGSVHEVNSGKRRFIGTIHDVTDFIIALVRDGDGDS